MRRMTFAQYDKEIEKFEVMPDPTHNYGLTEEDMRIIEDNPEKYIEFAMYLLTRTWYREENESAHIFDNVDAMRCKDVTFRLTDMLYDAIDLYDENEA